jgi:hypothetical protein
MYYCLLSFVGKDKNMLIEHAIFVCTKLKWMEQLCYYNAASFEIQILKKKHAQYLFY